MLIILNTSLEIWLLLDTERNRHCIHASILLVLLHTFTEPISLNLEESFEMTSILSI